MGARVAGLPLRGPRRPGRRAGLPRSARILGRHRQDRGTEVDRERLRLVRPGREGVDGASLGAADPRRGGRPQPGAPPFAASRMQRPIRRHRGVVGALGLPLRRFRAGYRRGHRRRLLEPPPPLSPRLATPPPRRAADRPALILDTPARGPPPRRPGFLRRDRSPALSRPLARDSAARHGKRLGAPPRRQDYARPHHRGRPGPRLYDGLDHARPHGFDAYIASTPTRLDPLEGGTWARNIAAAPSPWPKAPGGALAVSPPTPPPSPSIRRSSPGGSTDWTRRP